MIEEIEDCARSLGVSFFGQADIRSVRSGFLLDPDTSARFDFALSLGVRLSDAVLEDIRSEPTPLYFHHYKQANYVLDRAAHLVSLRLQERGYRALPVAASQVIDWQGQRGHVSHKKIGVLAGLGWIGRNNLLVNPEAGSRLRLVSVLTDMHLEPGDRLANGCGSCRRCVLVCPAGAVKDDPGSFDHLACYEKLREFRRRGLVGQYICGVCVRACRGPISC
ncbi:MAG: epoxyqueuosine reductase [Candidatus Aminicenantes bacterium]|nr:epoxyqueuosine reductase [Candidatus Aminicenantes bacterium]